VSCGDGEGGGVVKSQHTYDAVLPYKLVNIPEVLCAPAVRVTHNAFHVAPDPTPPPLVDGMLSSSQGSNSSFISNVMASTIRPQAPSAPPSKLASLQEFVEHYRDASEMGFSRSPPPPSIHHSPLKPLRCRC